MLFESDGTPDPLDVLERPASWRASSKTASLTVEHDEMYMSNCRGDIYLSTASLRTVLAMIY